MAYYVYVILCEDGSYYTGSTKNVKARFRQHKKGLGAMYTRMRKPEKVVHVEKYDSRKEAMRRERAIKRLSHKGKQKLAKLGYA